MEKRSSHNCIHVQCNVENLLNLINVNSSRPPYVLSQENVCKNTNSFWFDDVYILQSKIRGRNLEGLWIMICNQKDYDEEDIDNIIISGYNVRATILLIDLEKTS